MELASRAGAGVEAQAQAERAGLDLQARAAAAGDLAAFEAVYRGTVGRVFALAVRLLGAGEAEETTQEVYLRAWERLASWRGEAAFGTWLQRLALNALLNRRARGRASLVERCGEEAPEPQARAERGELRLDLEAAIASLPPGARAVFVLHDVLGHDHGEIAAQLSVSVGTSKSQLHRARLLLREALGSSAEDGHG
jgi:RNA polymerase sigma-70 factor (ECF subfamily)